MADRENKQAKNKNKQTTTTKARVTIRHSWPMQCDAVARYKKCSIRSSV